ncbi:uncharacterized protein LOC133501784 [Syngnathoides biaculeatus]|uniref:uncharacterized protein LOC133501784 n=1 Tax=Syngnathoides biaculeatus TaxID=300417 RepID=UPI002ADDBBD0|nr:uncharacterized protein LOC133501784 [Syngnathoides biaculeatus]XP_061677731.1 uncharacterized protein LOC133501784 [Syngnathoides biaculeatus]
MGRDRTIWAKQDPAGKTRRRRGRRKVDRLPEDQTCPIRVGSLTSSASVSYAPPASYEYIPTSTRLAPHILLDSDFLEYEEDRDLYDQLPDTGASSPGRFVGTRLVIYLGPPCGGQRRHPGRALPCASRCAATKTPSSHSSPATAKPADPQLVAKLPAQMEEELPNHEVFCCEMRVQIERQSAKMAALTAQVRQGLANQPSYADQIVEVHAPFEYFRIPDHQSVCTDLRLFSNRPRKPDSFDTSACFDRSPVYRLLPARSPALFTRRPNKHCCT